MAKGSKGQRTIGDLLKRLPSSGVSRERSERIVRVANSHSDDRELTIYVKGFLARGEQPYHFDAWHLSHKELEKRLGWGPRVYGYCWPSGSFDDILLPSVNSRRYVASKARGARGVGRVTSAGQTGIVVAEEIAQLVAAFTRQYALARSSATERANSLAVRLVTFRRSYERLRVVGHSLGCLHIIEAVSLLAKKDRPDFVHLCAPACREKDVGAKLDSLARKRAVIYYAKNDVVLRAAFPRPGDGKALGAVGQRRKYTKLVSVDAREFFRFWVHHRYKNYFCDFASEK